MEFDKENIPPGSKLGRRQPGTRKTKKQIGNENSKRPLARKPLAPVNNNATVTNVANVSGPMTNVGTRVFGRTRNATAKLAGQLKQNAMPMVETNLLEDVKESLLDGNAGAWKKRNSEEACISPPSSENLKETKTGKEDDLDLAEILKKEYLADLMAQIQSLFEGKSIPDPKTPVDPLDPHYKLEVFQNELEKEAGYNILDEFPKQFVAIREQLILKAKAFFDDYQFDPEALHLFTYFIDAFIIRLQRRILQLIPRISVFGYVVAMLAVKMQHSSRMEPEFYSQMLRETNQSPARYCRNEAKVIGILNYKLNPPTSTLFLGLILSQMTFPNPITKSLVRTIAEEILTDTLTLHKLIVIPASVKARFAIEACTSYFIANIETYDFLEWNEVTDTPFAAETYFNTLKALALPHCTEAFHQKCCKLLLDLQKAKATLALTPSLGVGLNESAYYPSPNYYII